MAKSRARRTKTLSGSFTVPPIIDRLPPETLAEIFSIQPPRCLKLPPRSTPSGTDVRTQSPWNLASVCRQWRDIAFSTPRLWSSFDVSVDSAPHPRLITTLQLFLGRSGNHPLTFKLHAPKDVPRSTFQQAMSSFVQRAGQWEDVTFTFALNLLSECTCLQQPDICFPQLLDLDIWCYSHIPHEELQLPAFQLFARASLLSQLGLERFSYPPSILHLPWHQITYLSMNLNDGGVEWLLDILEYTSNLSALDFNATNPRANLQPRTRGILELSHLRKLVWSCRFMFDDSAFFNHISAPLLTNLTLECSDWRHSAVQGFLQRSACSVTHVTLTAESSDEFRSFLGLFPDAEQLSVSATSGDFSLTEALTVCEENSAMTRVCPKLQRLNLHRMETKQDEESRSAFVEMVKSRFRGCEGLGGAGAVAKLESLRIFHYQHGSASGDKIARLYRILQERLSPNELELVHHQFVSRS
ncbi:hypothetical protein NP233_g4494 [Leucocoprinus birnbaumii]|uniref:F-box domain-containing protein n=1 Tax=Leucocoprinus birnbaumii TaxID=56174 RepID=A0AAD5VX55_9AGAR|nr:hypothetical protein NP233_g4494 [Leucocoprinus birnbaumii]